MRNFIFKFLFWSGFGPLSIAVMKIRRKVPIFLFHRISPNYDRFTEPIHPSQFDRTIRLLHRFYQFGSLHDLLKTPDRMQNNCFVVFDDATKDFMEYALQILQKWSVPVTMFVPTESMLLSTTIWNYYLFDVISSVPHQKFSFDFRNKTFFFDKNSARFYDQVMSLHLEMLSCEYDILVGAIATICRTFNIEIQKYIAPVCNQNEIRYLISTGVSIQSHSHKHIFLKGKSLVSIHSDLLQGRSILESVTGHMPTLIAYPNGGYDSTVLRIAKNLFDAGFSVDGQFAELHELEKPGEYRMRIPRLNVQDASFEEMIFRAMGLHKLLSRLISR